MSTLYLWLINRKYKETLLLASGSMLQQDMIFLFKLT